MIVYYNTICVNDVRKMFSHKLRHRNTVPSPRIFNSSLQDLMKLQWHNMHEFSEALKGIAAPV